MLTPSFQLSQDDTFLTIVIKARYAKISEAEIYVDGAIFKFYSKPYFLRLTLPGCIIEDGRESAKYDADKGYFTVTVPKETQGEYFDGLDMLTTLLAPVGKTSATEPVLEVIDTPAGNEHDQEITYGEDEAGKEEAEEEEEEEEIDWQVPQEPFVEDEMSMGGSTYYGFANRRTGVFERLQDELCGIVDIPKPDCMTLSARREERQQAEQLKFDEDHYIADFLEDDCIQSVLEYKPPWDVDYRKLMKGQSDEGKLLGPEISDSLVVLSEEERDQMMKLSKKNYLLDQKTEASVLLGLIDVLFAYAYDVRTTEGEHSVESAWTICKLSPTLSWLDWFTSLDDVINACFTRGLCYPLYRHWQLNLQVLEDVTMMFHLGRKQLLKCLLDIHRILSQDEPHYILNDLYITDYCVWIQSIGRAKILSLAQALDKFQIDKSQMALDLQKIEQTAATIKDDDDGDADEAVEDSDDTSDESDDDSEDDDSDDDSADEGDDESEDIMAKLTNAGKVKSKKRTHASNGGRDAGSKPCYYQYGYPDVLKIRHQLQGADDDFITEEDELVDRPLSDCFGNDSIPKTLISECVVMNAKDDIKQSEDIDLNDDINRVGIDTTTAADRDIITSKEEHVSVDTSTSPLVPTSSTNLSPSSQGKFGMHNIEEIVAALDDFAITNSEECEGSSYDASSPSIPPSSVKFSQSSQDDLVTSPSGRSSSGILSPSSQEGIMTQFKPGTDAICGSWNQRELDVDDLPTDAMMYPDGSPDVENLPKNKNLKEDEGSFESWMKAAPNQKIEVFSNT
ncbi:protein SHQ1 homolog [Amphiura filiformis]|uniref:protein SHQ1 homolog n=1 Tax=Amphiura filiformis TaxID=82378 RepID=UPI003B225EEB